jgi:2'-5' RNA ligase
MAASPTSDARLFVGIFVPPDLHGPLLTARGAIPGDWRWTLPEQLHLTLRFLGNVATEAVPDLIAALQPLAHHQPFPLTIAGWEGFPHRRSAHVLVRGVPLTPALEALWQETLGRSRRGLAVPLLDVAPLDWQATHVHLIESRLSPTGSSYEIRATVALGGDPWSRDGSVTPS